MEFGVLLINMANPFVPAQPEKMIQAKISAREANLITTLRKYPYGKFLIHKAEGLLMRVEITDSKLLNEKEGLELAIEE